MNDLLQQWLGLRLLDPWLVCLWLPVPWLLWRSARRHARPGVLLATAGLMSAGSSRRSRRRHVPPILQALALLALAIALGRPVRRERLAVTTLGIDVYLCMDASSSMLTALPSRDGQPQRTRLRSAAAAAAAFVASRPDDRFGLVRFARFADLLSPLTLDHESIQQNLGALQAVEAKSEEDLTGIGTAIGRAAQFLATSKTKSRVIILLTDGEETVATPERTEAITPQQAAIFCRDAGIRVYSIVVGTGASNDPNPVDTRPLRAAVEATGGQLFEAGDAEQLRSIYRAIAALEVSPLEAPRFRLAECFAPFAIAALGLWLLAELAAASWARVTPC